MSVITSSRDGQQVPLKKPPRASAEHVDKTYPLWFHIPGGLVYLVLFIVPTVFSFYFAFTRWTLFKSTFIGFDNFVLFFNEPGLIGSLKNTLIYGFLTSSSKVVLGMLLAVVLSAPIIARGYLRSVTFFPVLISAVGVGLTFQVLLDPFNGIVNKVISSMTGADGPGWLTDPNIALLSVVGIDVWKGIGLATLIYIAGIAAIPNEYFEAARVDGASAWNTFRFITLPLIMPYIMVAVVITNTTVIVEAIIAIASYVIEQVAGLVTNGGTNYDTISGIKGSGIVGKMIIGFFAILIWLVRMASIMVVNILITIRFIQLYLMIPFAPVTIPTFLSDDWRSVGIGYLKNIMVYAVQGILIFLIVSLVPLFESAGKIAVSNGAGVMESLAIMFGGLVQAILLIIALVGSQRTARSILGM